MEKENTTIKEYTLGFGEANLWAILVMIPIPIIFGVPFVLIWDTEALSLGKDLIIDHFLWILIVGIIVHELLHGIVWAYYAPHKMKSIKFGIKMLTPYCHCKEPLQVKHYMLGGAMPLIVLGIIPAVIGIVLGNGASLVLGVLFIMVAGGDILILFMMRKLDKNIYVSDHPSKVGFYTEIEEETDTNNLES